VGIVYSDFFNIAEASRISNDLININPGCFFCYDRSLVLQDQRGDIDMPSRVCAFKLRYLFSDRSHDPAVGSGSFTARLAICDGRATEDQDQQDKNE
jgi:hypothetical protein